MSTRAALSGSLNDLPVGDLLSLLGSSNQQGVVELTGATPGLIVLEAGAITLALTDDGPTLQQVVVGSGITSADGWEHAHNQSLRGAPLAAALIDGGADEALLKAALREQTTGALFEFLLPSATDFAFLPGATHPLGDRFLFDSTELLAEAGERVEAWKVIAETIPTTAMVMQIKPDLPSPSITISAEDWRILALVDGRTSVADVIRALGMSAFAVCGVMHRLVLAGCIEAVPG